MSGEKPGETSLGASLAMLYLVVVASTVPFLLDPLGWWTVPVVAAPAVAGTVLYRRGGKAAREKVLRRVAIGLGLLIGVAFFGGLAFGCAWLFGHGNGPWAWVFGGLIGLGIDALWLKFMPHKPTGI